MAALPPFPSLAHSTLRLLHAVDSDIHGRAGGQAKARKVWRGIASSDIGSKCGLVRRRYNQIALSLQNSSSLRSFSVRVHSPQRPSLLPSLVLEMDDVARFSLLCPHPRTHARMREALEGGNERGAERERGRAEADGRTAERTDGRGLCYSELRHQERESTLICCLLLLDSRGGAALGDAEDACHLRQKAQSMSQSEVTNDPRCIAISGERGAREGAREPACSRAMRGLSTTNYRSEGPLNFAARRF